MILIIYASSLILLAALPLVMMSWNLKQFTRATKEPTYIASGSDECVSVLIPARNEESSIRAALESILLFKSDKVEVIVLDDCSEDATATIVQEIGSKDSRLRLIASKALPEGWNGKQHACWMLAQSANHPWLLFLDADVRFTKDAIPRMVGHAIKTEIDLLSGFPCQETKSIGEQLLIPLMHFVLLGYLPIAQMRKSTDASLAAGCGQLMLAKRNAYFQCDGHRALRNSRHDGIQLPRAFRRENLRTDIFDASDIAKCRMYTNFAQVIRGLLKNATEGIASNRLIVLFTVLLGGASVLPFVSLAIAYFNGLTGVNLFTGLLLLATILSWTPRCLASIWFSQSILGAILHPFSIALFLILQWIAWGQNLVGAKVLWRGRH